MRMLETHWAVYLEIRPERTAANVDYMCGEHDQERPRRNVVGGTPVARRNAAVKVLASLNPDCNAMSEIVRFGLASSRLACSKRRIP
jgi:hypothetical protein